MNPSDLFQLPNVVGYGKGTKKSQGIDTGVSCLMVYVTAKLPLSALSEGEIVPKTLDDGTLTDVVQLSPSHTLDDPVQHQKRHKPLLGGISCGWKWWPGTGTLGAIFQDTQGNYLLHSNNHVIAMSWNPPMWRGQKGDVIRQPGVKDAPVDEHGNILSDPIAQLEDWSDIDPQGVNKLDAAVAKLTEEGLPLLLGLGSYTDWQDTPEIGKTYSFSGRTSGVRPLTLLGTDVSMLIGGYGNFAGTIFEGLHLFGPGGQPGDSGSSIVDGNKLFSILFAGGADHTLGIPYALSRERFGLKIPSLSGIPIEEALDSIFQDLVDVWGFDNASKIWSSYYPGDPASELRFLKPGNGYWVEVKQPCVLEHQGKRWELTPKDNLVGW